MRSLLFGAADIVAKTANSNTTRNISRREVTGINERYNYSNAKKNASAIKKNGKFAYM